VGHGHISCYCGGGENNCSVLDDNRIRIRVPGIFISTLGAALVESRLRMKYDSEIEEKSLDLDQLQSDIMTGHSMNLNAEAKNFIKLEIDEIKKRTNEKLEY
jgi:hypothetical protein